MGINYFLADYDGEWRNKNYHRATCFVGVQELVIDFYFALMNQKKLLLNFCTTYMRNYLWFNQIDYELNQAHYYTINLLLE